MSKHWIDTLQRTDGTPPIWYRPYVTTDFEVLHELVKQDCYALDSWDIPAQGAGTVILDIGGHIGVFAALAATRWPHAKIISIEPFYENFRIHTLNTIAFSNVRPVLGAIVGKDAGHAVAIDNIQHEAARRVVTDGVLPVLGLSAQEILAACGDGKLIIKTDCEGMETTILRELLPLRKPVRIVGEWHYNKQEVLDLLSGYQVTVQDYTPDLGLFKAEL